MELEDKRRQRIWESKNEMGKWQLECSAQTSKKRVDSGPFISICFGGWMLD
jgi:hypothetical protein